mmetsp:Transcript_6393/g.15829  ORF Transcript_6393/g.15829 Transcript_6393/m.15829 type:complete len:111 (+) Transcript_6393:3003-3335(+)
MRSPSEGDDVSVDDTPLGVCAVDGEEEAGPLDGAPPETRSALFTLQDARSDVSPLRLPSANCISANAVLGQVLGEFCDMVMPDSHDEARDKVREGAGEGSNDSASQARDM